jgi:phage baseplate assembly protein V
VSYDLSETYRKLAALIRWGTVTSVDTSDPTAPRVTCTAGGLDTEPIPWHAVRAGTTSKWSAPVIGEQGIVFAPGGETTNGFFLGGFYQTNMPAPSTNPNVEMTLFPDGSTVQYDSSSNTLTVSVSGNGNVVVNCKQATVNASSEVTLNTPTTHATGNVQIDGNLGVTGTMAIQGHGANGGAVSTFAGSIAVTGGEVSADGIGLKEHHHTEHDGYNTSAAEA